MLRGEYEELRTENEKLIGEIENLTRDNMILKTSTLRAEIAEMGKSATPATTNKDTVLLDLAIDVLGGRVTGIDAARICQLRN